MKKIKVLVATLTVFFNLCMGLQTVSFKENIKYVEATTEKKDTITIRFIALQNSILNINDFKVRKCKKGNIKEYYISLHRNSMGSDHNLVKGMTEPSWGGIKLEVPVEEFNKEKDLIFYKDGFRKNPIKMGTIDSWKRIISNSYRNVTVPDSTKEQILNDPNF